MDILVNGVLLGMGYCLIAVGLALIWGVAKVIDLVYGSYGIIAAYVVVILIAGMGTGFPIWLISIIGLAAVVGIALVIYNFLILPVRKQPDVVLVTTIALSLVIQELLIFKEGSEPVYLPALLTGTANILGVWTTGQKLLMAGVNIGIMALLWVFLTGTKLGLYWRHRRVTA
jgi:branched-subunit amino acid ABC-type transport system permease component